MRKVEIHFECVVSCLVVKIFLVFGGVAEIDVVMQELVGSHERGFGKLLIVARNFDLFSVFKSFFEVVVGRGELLEFF